MGFIRPASSESWFEDEDDMEWGMADEPDQNVLQAVPLSAGVSRPSSGPEPPNWWALTTRPSLFEWLDQEVPGDPDERA